jgi:hypothetical protein
MTFTATEKMREGWGNPATTFTATENMKEWWGNPGYDIYCHCENEGGVWHPRLRHLLQLRK